MDEPSARRHTGRVVAGVVAAAVLAMWGFIFFYHLSGQWRAETPGRLDDTDFAALAEQRCAAAHEALAALPPAWATPDPDDRADVVAASNELFAAMVADLRASRPSDPEDRARVDEWLTDWETYVGDREGYAERVRVDPGTRLWVTQSERDSRQVTQALDRFAAINGMPSCIVPNDLA